MCLQHSTIDGIVQGYQTHTQISQYSGLSTTYDDDRYDRKKERITESGFYKPAQQPEYDGQQLRIAYTGGDDIKTLYDNRLAAYLQTPILPTVRQ